MTPVIDLLSLGLQTNAIINNRSFEKTLIFIHSNKGLRLDNIIAEFLTLLFSSMASVK